MRLCEASARLAYGAAYTDPVTGFQYLNNRYYDPSTGQFITQDPDLAQTGQPYEYADDNPRNNTDPSGLDDTIPASTGPYAGQNVATEASKFAAYCDQDPRPSICNYGDVSAKAVLTAVGIGLGVVSIATGVGAVAGLSFVVGDLGTVTAVELGAASAGSGLAGGALDGADCAAHPSVGSLSCIGAGLNGLGGGLGVASTLIDAGVVEASELLSKGLGAAGLGAGVGGLGVDVADASSGC